MDMCTLHTHIGKTCLERYYYFVQNTHIFVDERRRTHIYLHYCMKSHKVHSHCLNAIIHIWCSFKRIVIAASTDGIIEQIIAAAIIMKWNVETASIETERYTEKESTELENRLFLAFVKMVFTHKFLSSLRISFVRSFVWLYFFS